MKCPKCEGELNKVTVKVRPEYGGDILNDAEQVNEIQLDQCLSCNGVWFDIKELDQYLSEKLLILDSRRVSNSKELNKKQGPCPKCNKVMQQKIDSKGAGITIDFCEKCQGVWLDSSELDSLENINLSISEKHALVWRTFKRNLDKIFKR